MLKDIFKTKKHEQAEPQILSAEAERRHREQAETKATQEKADRERQESPEQVAVYKLLDAALRDTELRWISDDAKTNTHKFYSPALSADIYLTYIFAVNNSRRTDYRVRFNDSIEVFLQEPDPVGKLAKELHEIGCRARFAANNAERKRREQILFDLAARVKSR
ncbi:hypothetical protein HDR61_03150 [bacterium]|nr:hypothetical protein [bacterium]